MQGVVPEIEALGATLVAITPQLAEHNRALVSKRGLTFELLSDPGNAVASAFKLTFRLPDDLETVYRAFTIELPAYNGDDSWTLPLTARYVIDSGGQIRAAAVNADYTRRPEPEETVNAVKAVTHTGQPGAWSRHSIAGRAVKMRSPPPHDVGQIFVGQRRFRSGAMLFSRWSFPP